MPIVKASDIAFARLQVPDLDVAAQFLLDFGLEPVERTATALYVRYASGEQEYYNTARDPFELDNIASSGVPAALRTALAALASCHGGASCWAAAHLPR